MCQQCSQLGVGAPSVDGTVSGCRRAVHSRDISHGIALELVGLGRGHEGARSAGGSRDVAAAGRAANDDGSRGRNGAEVERTAASLHLSLLLLLEALLVGHLTPSHHLLVNLHVWRKLLLMVVVLVVVLRGHDGAHGPGLGSLAPCVAGVCRGTASPASRHGAAGHGSVGIVGVRVVRDGGRTGRAVASSHAHGTAAECVGVGGGGVAGTATEEAARGAATVAIAEVRGRQNVIKVLGVEVPLRHALLVRRVAVWLRENLLLSSLERLDESRRVSEQDHYAQVGDKERLVG